MDFELNSILSVMKKKEYIIFENGSTNLIGVRGSSSVPNTFNDKLYYICLGSRNIFKKYDVTTDPGTPYLLKPINPKGTLIMKPGQHKGLWMIGKHRGKYDALVQVGYCTVLRDNNKNNVLDFNTTLEETNNNFGANCHKAANGIISKWVGPHSAGCIVHADANRFDNEFMVDIKHDAKIWGNRFTFTLLEEKDFKEVV